MPLSLSSLEAPPPWWWLSFADPDLPSGQQWLGGCFAPGVDVAQAAIVAHAAGCNPGGEVLGVAVADHHMAQIAERDRLRLITDHAYLDNLVIED